LKYPFLPTVNISGGSLKKQAKKKILVPVELITVPSGQIRNSVGQDISSKIIKEAAMLPNHRLSYLTKESVERGLFQALSQDGNACTFGLAADQSDTTTPTGSMDNGEGITSKRVKVHATILPPPKFGVS